MTTPDLDARVAEAVARMESRRAGGAWSGADAEATALIRDLHAALKAARGEEFEALYVHDGGAELGEFFPPRDTDHVEVHRRELQAILGRPFTVRRVLCRIAPDDGGSQ